MKTTQAHPSFSTKHAEELVNELVETFCGMIYLNLDHSVALIQPAKSITKLHEEGFNTTVAQLVHFRGIVFRMSHQKWMQHPWQS